MHRTFIKLADDELRFLRQLQAVVRKKHGKRITMSKVVRDVVRDYQRVLEQGAEPDFLASYRREASTPKV